VQALGRRSACVGDDLHRIEKTCALFFTQRFQDARLQFHGDLARLLERPAALRHESDAMRSPIRLVRATFNQPILLHADERGGDGVRVAGHQVRYGALGQALRVSFAEPAQNTKLIGGNFEGVHALAKRLVQSIPGAAEENGQPLGRLERGVGRWNFVWHGAPRKRGTPLAGKPLAEEKGVPEKGRQRNNTCKYY
jgi:hypothetical protein